MMKLIKNINKLFIKSNNSARQQETELKFELTLTAKTISIPKKDELLASLDNFSNGDVLEISISIDSATEFHIYSNNTTVIDNFLADLEALKKQREEDSQFELRVTINKKVEGQSLNIYCYSAFIDFLESKSLKNLFYIFNNLIIQKKVSNFIFYDEELTLKTQTLLFSNKKKNPVNNSIDREKVINIRNEVCHFNQSSKLHLLPYDFFITNSTYQETRLSKLLNKLAVLNSFIFLSDVSEIRGENSLFLKINGYKTVSHEFNFDSISTDSLNDIVNIVKWVYSEGGINDKIGLTRNILSITLNLKTLEVGNNAYNSIQSNYEIYLKANVEQYINVKNKVSDHLVEASQKAGKIVEDFNKTFRNNFFAFFSFFFTVLIIRVVSVGNADNIFTKEIALISFAFLATSLIYLIIATWHSFNERDRFDNVYNNLKGRYEDLLNPDDLQSIFSKNNDHGKDLSYIKKNIWIHSTIWFLSIIGLAFLVYSLSGFKFL